MASRLEGTEYAKDAIQRVKYTHDAMIDLILERPMISQIEISRIFGYHPNWVSMVLNSDAFLVRLAERKTELIDPTLVASIEERLRAMASVSSEIIMEKLAKKNDPAFALEVMALSTKALGFGARQQNVVNQTSFVVQMPEKAASEEAWASRYVPGGKPLQIPEDIEMMEVPKPSLTILDLIEPGSA